MRSHASKLGAVALMALVAVVPTLMPAPARACSYGAPIIEAAFPMNGAIDVPTNGVFFLYGSLGIEPEYFTLTDEAGTEVSVEVSAAEPRGVIIRPLTELEPQERYELRVGYEDTNSQSPIERLAFTTGAGPQVRSETPPAPTVALRELTWPGPCDPLHAMCVDGVAPSGYVMQIEVDNELLLVQRVSEFPVRRFANCDFPDDGCVDIRFRGLLGDLSPTTELCGTEVERLTLRNPGWDQAYSCDDDAVLQAASASASDLARSAAPDAAVAGGCSITSPASTPRRGWLGWSVLGLVLAARASRAGRSVKRRG